MPAPTAILIHDARDPWTGAVRDVLLAEGLVRLPGASGTFAPEELDGPRTERLDAAGRWLVPGLWDAHVHLDQWAQARTRLDLAGTGSPEDVLAAVARGLRERPGTAPFLGFGHRSSAWEEQPTVAALDAVTASAAPGRPVVLISGDMHSAWANTAALEMLGAPRTEGLLAENDWFAAFARLEKFLPPAAALVPAALEAAAARGVVGLTDLEFAPNPRVWSARAGLPGFDRVRVRAGVYAGDLEEVLAAGLRTGDRLAPPEQDPDGLLRMGPFKVISDGSLGTGTAHCCAPYLDPPDAEYPRGRQNASPEVLETGLATARDHGLETALHAIGDAAVAHALEAFRATGARGSVEHAQLMRPEDVGLLAELGLAASVQPAHLLDDRDTTERLWGPERAGRSFVFRTMTEHGVPLAFGSDAPVSPLDPWLAMSAAVHRSADERPAWHPEQALTPAEALAASTDGVARIADGAAADVVLVEENPLGVPGEDSAAAGRRLRDMPVAATFVAGRATHCAL